MTRTTRPDGAQFVLGVDVGGTFVDCAVVIDGQVVVTAKAPSTAGEPLAGLLDALAAAADAADLELADLLARTSALVHGTTVGLNALLTREGATVGLLATRGHEDAILIGRVHQKVAGLGPEEIIRVADLAKPQPLVPRWRIHGIDERIDATGAEVVRLDEAGVAQAADALAAEGCDSIAIAFLWSFRNPAHEHRAAEIVRDRLPDIPVSVSCDVAPVIGEYERTAATVVNAYLRGTQRDYLARLDGALRERGFRGTLEMLLSSGGTATAVAVADRPVETLRSGPVGGSIAVSRLGAQLGARNLLATDMGGTSFDVGLVLDGRPELTDVSLAGQLHLAVPSVDIASIGAGGSSVVWVDPDGGLHIGPRSMGAEPGPACYGRGGTEATVTDADLVLGRLNPHAVLGGRIALDRAAAERAVRVVADSLGLDLESAAAGIVRVADAKMADLVRRVTVERGHDPRGLVLVAYGGAAGLHAGAYGLDAGAKEVVIPRYASMLSAVGLAQADAVRAYRRSGPLGVPLDADAVAAAFAAMEVQAHADLRGVGRGGGGARRTARRPRIRREIDFRYRRQTHQVAVRLEFGTITEARLGRAVERFEREYERLHGAGAGYRAAGIEATSFRVIATVPAHAPIAATGDVGPLGREDGGGRSARPAGRRAVRFDAWSGLTDAYDGDALRPGDRIGGPAVVDWPTTAAVIHPGQVGTVDPFGHLHLVREG